jgi:hypothetical protein
MPGIPADRDSAVSSGLERNLAAWTAAGVLDGAAAQRIRDFEHARGAPRSRWPAFLALAFGALLLGAGILLFVAAHWATLSPAARFAVVVATIASVHVAAAWCAEWFEALAIALHAVGTIALGGGIFLVAQIFNVEEPWPLGVGLWALGAGVAWAIRRDWPQALLAAVLTPFWLTGEWWVRTGGHAASHWAAAELLLGTAFTYLSARAGDDRRPVRRALAWTGSLSVVPCVLYVVFASAAGSWERWDRDVPTASLGLVVGLALPVGLAYVLRGRAAWMNAVAAVWAAGLGALAVVQDGPGVAVYAWEAVGAVGVVAWGLAEGRRERVNVGIAGFGLALLGFYFSSVMDKLDRALSLIVLGLLFLVGGWLLERTRRRLLATLPAGGAGA